MVLLQSTYGITFSMETFAIIVLAIVVGIVFTWVKGFVAKPDTVSTDLKHAEARLSKEINDIKLIVNDLKHAIADNTNDDRKEREALVTRINKSDKEIDDIKKNMWEIVREALKTNKLL